MGGAKAEYDCVKALSETDFTEDLKVIDVPMLVMHGDDDQIVPIADSAPLSAKLFKKSSSRSSRSFRTACARRTPTCPELSAREQVVSPTDVHHPGSVVRSPP